MPVHLPPRQAGVLTCRTNLRCGQELSIGRRRSSGPSAHWYRHPRNRYTKSHWVWWIEFKPYATNGRSWLIIQTFRQSRHWCHVGNQFWRDQFLFWLLYVERQLACEIRQPPVTRVTNRRTQVDAQRPQSRARRVFLTQDAFHPAQQYQPYGSH